MFVALLVLFVCCAFRSAFVVCAVAVVFCPRCLSSDCAFVMCVLSDVVCGVCVGCTVVVGICVSVW